MSATSQATSGPNKSLRLHIALMGRCNTGKSSLLNALACQDIALVSAHPGTTTDPVEKVMELAPLGPVVFIDTAGMNVAGELGEARMQRSRQALLRCDIALLVVDHIWDSTEEALVRLLQQEEIPFAIVCNKADRNNSSPLPPHLDPAIPRVTVSARTGEGLDNLRQILQQLTPAEEHFPLLHDLLPPHGLALFVVPLDSGAPRGRLIMPQVQALRDTLDGRCLSFLCTEQQLEQALSRLSCPPDLVVCDSQVVDRVAAAVPPQILLTTFSILMARAKADLVELVRGALALTKLQPGDTVIIQEACSHHPQKDDIGRVKIPRLLQKMAGGPLATPMIAGKHGTEYPPDILAMLPRAVIHCGACALTRKQMNRRLRMAREQGLPMTNYGMAISLAQGVLHRALSPFPDALALLEEKS